MKTNSVARVVVSRFKLKGLSLKGWAAKNGFKENTVHKTIRGERGSTKSGGVSTSIREALMRDGFWPKDDEVVNG